MWDKSSKSRKEHVETPETDIFSQDKIINQK